MDALPRTPVALVEALRREMNVPPAPPAILLPGGQIAPGPAVSEVVGSPLMRANEGAAVDVTHLVSVG
ncbi:MAG: hypothetical protein IPL78_34465 [Chloroflexi bacterium]|nr:hypothetical protein [Chloroflexota bacterium]